MFSSIRTSIGAVVILAISTASLSVLWFTLNEHEELYLESQKNNLYALSRNISSDLVPDMESYPLDPISIMAILLRLDPYQDVIHAAVYDNNFSLIESYVGRRGRELTQIPTGATVDPSLYPLGITIDSGRLISIDRIGEQSFPLGYLLIVNDTQEAISVSRHSLAYRSAPWILLIISIASVVFLFIVNRAFAPLSLLSLFTKRVIDTKNYSLRYKQQGDNEIGKLGKHINRLMTTIEDELSINVEQNNTLLEQQEAMTRLANFDSLTGLPNRQFVMDTLRFELANARRRQEDLVLLFFDLDGFKGINDSLGHETGDMILIDVAERVKRLLRENDLIARLGGDEFLIIPNRDSSDVSINNMANRLLNAFSEPFCLKGLSLKVGVSIGIAKATDAEFELSQLISNADLAMYRSKANGRGTFTIFSPEMSESHKRKIALANSIDQAVTEDQFELMYQPKVAMDGRIVGFEALIRWQHPTMGFIMPGEFIPIAEHGGKITLITHWVIEQVCKHVADISSMYPNKIRIGINLSAHDLRHHDLFDVIYRYFRRYEVNPECIEFEVTESAYLKNFIASNRFFNRLSNLGCAISLDDFGTGYSSLSYLTQINIDTLKIDRQFIREMESSKASKLVTGSIIDLAKRLSLNICAEGIENKQQCDYLIAQGCDTMQGYLFSKPIPFTELSRLPKSFAALVANSNAKDGQ
jgi:diguanylate cyclase (GGDEF)-like protein